MFVRPVTFLPLLAVALFVLWIAFGYVGIFLLAAVRRGRSARES